MPSSVPATTRSPGRYRADGVLRQKIQRLIEAHGDVGAANALEMSVSTVLRLATGCTMRRGSLLLAEAGLSRLRASASRQPQPPAASAELPPMPPVPGKS